MMFRFAGALFFCLVTAFSMVVVPSVHAAGVDSFSPQGTVKGVRQVAARFSDQMVAFGDPRLSDPFEVKCGEKGKGRWVDGKNWSYDFERDLPAGVVCTFTLKPAVKTLSGKPLTGQKQFTFTTGGPSVIDSEPFEGDESIDENQRFVFTLDAEADEKTVSERVYCSVEGIQERVGIRLITGKEKDDLFAAIKHRKGRGPTVVFECRRTFPQEAVVKVVWGKGVRSKSGVATTEDQVLPYRTRKPFTARFSCMKEKPDAGCMPLSPMRLDFTAPVSVNIAGKIALKNSKGRVWGPAKIEDTEGRSYIVAGGKVYQAKAAGAERFVQSVSFQGPFPENTAFTLTLPPGFKDDAGRKLANADKFPLQVKTHIYPPLARFAAPFGIIESADPVLPVTVRNIETQMRTWIQSVESEGGKQTAPRIPSAQAGAAKDKEEPEIGGSVNASISRVASDREETIIAWLKRLRRINRTESVFGKGDGKREVAVPRPGRSREFEVVGIPLKEPGFYVVELESKLLGARLLSKPGPMHVPASALVTNMAAHFKWGRQSSLVWVTSLHNAAPVADAAVTLRDCSGKLIWQGKTDAKGIAKISGELPSAQKLSSCPLGPERQANPYDIDYPAPLGDVGSGLFVFAKKGNDMTFTHSSWNEGIAPWRFNFPTAAGYADKENCSAHTVFDRTLLRAGETLHMKHFIRQKDMVKGFVIPPVSLLPGKAVIRHAGSDQEYAFPLKWNTDGTAEMTWEVPKNAKLGTYQVTLEQKAAATGKEAGRKVFGTGWQTGSFRVEEFRVPLMRAIVQGPREPVVKPKEVHVDVSLTYLSGGGASLAAVKLRSEIRQKSISFPDYEDFVFSNGGVKKGVEKPLYEDEETEYEEGRPVVQRRGGGKGQDIKLKTLELTLDQTGSARATLKDIPGIDRPGDLLTELEFRDPNGETQTVSSHINVYPAKLHAGIAVDGTGEGSLRYRAMAVDLKGQPLADATIKVNLLQRKTYSHRRRVAGGFYAYEHTSEIMEAGPHCEGRTSKEGILFCEGKSPVSGEIILQAEARDGSGNVSTAHAEQYVYGVEDQWFGAGQDDRIDLVPERKRYEPGETARFEVRMPFREAALLISVEREGIMDTYVRKISRKEPVFEIPVKDYYAPNAYVSALVVRGRVADTKPTATFDPGKPAYKLGITEIKVGWRNHELKVNVATPRKTYRVRETVETKINVKTALGKTPPKGSEVAVAAVDEGLLELKPNESWKLLEAMMKRRPYEVTTSTAQMMVAGKRHFGRKALPHGGGGGKQTTRELFDTLLFWKARIALDEKGEATVKIPLNDSLTSFRIVAIASAGASLFGTGSTSVVTTQDLMVLSGLPPLVREGDLFTAGFTVRNTSGQPMDVEAKLILTDGTGKKELTPIARTLAAGESCEIGWDVSVPFGSATLGYEVRVADKASGLSDTVKVSQKVVPAVPVRTFQATLLQLKEPLRMSVERPDDAIPGRGGIHLGLKPKIAEGLDGVAGYMSQYPYVCLEQRVSKAVALRNGTMWQKIMAELPSYLDADGLVRYFPASFILGSDVLTSYVLAVAHEAGYVIPGNLLARMKSGLKGFVEGRITRWSSLPTADLAIRKVAAVEALSRYKESGNKLLDSVAVEPNLWPTSAVLDWISVLDRTADIPDRATKLRQAQTILRSRLNFQGTVMGLSTEKSDYCWWLMVSPDTNAVRTLLTTLAFDSWDQDAPRIARGVIGRLRKGHWNTTVANAWGVLAMEKFSKKFESIPVTGTTGSSLGRKSASTDWAKTPKGSEIMLPWPAKKEALRVAHQGGGSPWLTVQSLAAIPLKEPLSSGYRIRKTVSPVEQKTPGKWSRGDAARVQLEIDAQTDMTWVVVDDPIPAGATILGSGLGRDSAFLTKQESEKGRAREVFRERSFEAMKAYFEYVWKGKFTVEYTVRLNNEGTFNLPPTRVEALYSPELFGELPNSRIQVVP
ncbi:MAG: hypothetical protein A4E57_00702 [Syntrophorhabdaceae bacterium PtaU1.Bin034]|nr:MAG: hypothetical protein A4E57_00702 [Syntrophorhabdaceae bacterium PtaU1.Bin034]